MLSAFPTSGSYNQVDSSRLVVQDFVALFREGKIFNGCLDDQVDGVLHVAANGL